MFGKPECDVLQQKPHSGDRYRGLQHIIAQGLDKR